MEVRKRIYYSAFLFLFLSISVSQYLIHMKIDESQFDSRQINLSGRQRMLSQEIAKLALKIEKARNQNEVSKLIEKLAEESRSLERSHHALQLGEKSLGLDNVSNSPAIDSLFDQIDPFFQNITQSVRFIAELDPRNQESQIIKITRCAN